MGSEEDKQKISIDEYNKINCSGMFMRGLGEVFLIEAIKATFITKALDVVKDTIFKGLTFKKQNIAINTIKDNLRKSGAPGLDEIKEKSLSRKFGWKSQGALKKEILSELEKSGLNKEMLDRAIVKGGRE